MHTVEPHAAVTHRQLQLCTCSFVLIGAGVLLAAADGECGVGDGVGCVGDSFQRLLLARHPWEVGHLVLQRTLEYSPLGSWWK